MLRTRSLLTLFTLFLPFIYTKHDDCRRQDYQDIIEEATLEDSCSLPGHRRLHSSLATWRLAKTQQSSLLWRDPNSSNHVRKVSRALFSYSKPTPLKTRVHLAAVWPEVLDLLDLSPEIAKQDSFVQVACGNSILLGSTPLAHRYGGHQFSIWAGQLGDGRAHLLGEYVNARGERWHLQLKGSGKTPYSRRGDGRAVVRSSVREFLASEALYHLGIGTSRAASLVVSSDPIVRDQFYNGNVRTEPGAVVLRLAQTWFRIGTLELLAEQREFDILEDLVDHIIKEHFPHIDVDDKNKYFEFYNDIINKTAYMVAQWQSIGFAHGVCNTDNFSLLGITIDYGPFGFMEAYDPEMVPNTSDDESMYSYEKQPQVAAFNLDKLRISLLPLLPSSQHRILSAVLEGYWSVYREHYENIFRKKLCLEKAKDFQEILQYLFYMMAETKSDFTMTFRQLSDWLFEDIKKGKVPSSLWSLKRLSKHKNFSDWRKRYAKALQQSDCADDHTRQSRLHQTNPRYVLRNWMAQEAIGKTEKRDFTVLYRLQRVLRRPFEEQSEAEMAGYADPPPEWANELKVSCSS